MRCLRPIPLKDEHGRTVEVPCGKCPACRKEKSKAWALRMVVESLYWKECIFLTLTYDDDHIPTCAPTLTSQGHLTLPFTLCKDDVQRFWKRLRKAIYPRKIRYYLCGEYGDNTFRPHYHAVVFGLGYADRPVVESCWRDGFVYLEDVNLATCNYVAGYVQKKLYGDVSKDVYGNRLPPFACMSKGIGRQYVQEHWREIMDDGFILYHGSRLRVPRYFWESIVNDGFLVEHEVISYRRKMADSVQESLDRFYAGRGIKDGFARLIAEEKERLAVEACEAAKLRLYRRNKI